MINWQPPIPFKWKGNHHAYHGIWIMGFGLFNWYMGMDNGYLTNAIPIWQAMVGIGVFMIVDDAIEHTLTSSTPLRIIHEKIIVPILMKMPL